MYFICVTFHPLSPDTSIPEEPYNIPYVLQPPEHQVPQIPPKSSCGLSQVTAIFRTSSDTELLWALTFTGGHFPVRRSIGVWPSALKMSWHLMDSKTPQVSSSRTSGASTGPRTPELQNLCLWTWCWLFCYFGTGILKLGPGDLHQLVCLTRSLLSSSCLLISSLDFWMLLRLEHVSNIHQR